MTAPNPDSALPTDPSTSAPWAMVLCGDCGRVYQCTPDDDHYIPAGGPLDGPRVCTWCLYTRNRTDGVWGAQIDGSGSGGAA